MAKETNFEHPPKGHLALLAYDPANDRWQAVHVDDSGNLQVDITAIVDGQIHLYGWDGDSWEKLQVDANKYLKVTLPLEEALGARAYNYDGSNWRRANMLWGYNDRWAERATNLNADAGTNNLSTTAVPAGYVYWAAAVRMLNNTSTITQYRLEVLGGGVAVPLKFQDTPAAGDSLLWSGGLPLKEGDQIRAIFYGCTAGDDLYLDVWGYKMKVDM